jgi:hypothetical protein
MTNQKRESDQQQSVFFKNIEELPARMCRFHDVNACRAGRCIGQNGDVRSSVSRRRENILEHRRRASGAGLLGVWYKDRYLLFAD